MSKATKRTPDLASASLSTTIEDKLTLALTHRFMHERFEAIQAIITTETRKAVQATVDKLEPFLGADLTNSGEKELSKVLNALQKEQK